MVLTDNHLLQTILANAAGIEPATPIKVLSHYCNDSASAEWLTAMREIETEGEITPAQSDPHPAVMDESTPALLRKQAA